MITVVDAAAFRQWKSTAHSIGDVPLPLTAWASGFGGASVVSAADSAVGPGRLAALRVFWRQVALADCIIVSKSELVSAEDLQELTEAIPAINPFAEVRLESGSSPSVAPLPIGSSCNLGAATAAMRSQSKGKRFCGTRPAQVANHLEGVETLTITLPSRQALHQEPLKTLVTQLLAGDLSVEDATMDAWRVKGLVPVVGEGVQLLQGVGDQVELDAWPHAVATEPFLVVIGEHLHRSVIEHAILACAESRLMPELNAGDDAMKS